MTCPDPPLVTASGFVGGKDIAGLCDAYTKMQGSTEPVGGAMAQWQLWSLLSSEGGVCARFVNGGQVYLANEATLRVVVTGWKEYPASAPWAPPAADLPLVLPVVDPGPDGTTTSDGVHRVLRAAVMVASKNGRLTNSVDATSGTVTFTQVSDVDPGKGQSGTFDLWFGTDHVIGSFTASWCA